MQCIDAGFRLFVQFSQTANRRLLKGWNFLMIFKYYFMKFSKSLLTALLLSFAMLCPSVMQAQKVILAQ